MARPLRLNVRDGWYHVTSRGNERRAIFRDDRDRGHFLELLGELGEEYQIAVHAFVLMDNHYHLVVQTPLANLSEAMHWLGLSYGGWFNRRHRRAGHLLQGRFEGILMEGPGVAAAVSCYVHANPAQVRSLGLDKAARRQSRAGLAAPPSAEVVQERLLKLRKHRWSSYPAYVGWTTGPSWLTTGKLLAAVGGARARRDWPAAYREDVEALVREGRRESPWEQLSGGLLLGSQEFVRRMQKRLRGNVREQPSLRNLQAKVDFAEVVRVVEQEKGERWEDFRDRHGDWGRDLALWLARRCCGLSLRRLGEAVGGVDYATVSNAVARFAKKAETDQRAAAARQHCLEQLKNEKT